MDPRFLQADDCSLSLPHMPFFCGCLADDCSSSFPAHHFAQSLIARCFEPKSRAWSRVTLGFYPNSINLLVSFLFLIFCVIEKQKKPQRLQFGEIRKIQSTFEDGSSPPLLEILPLHPFQSNAVGPFTLLGFLEDILSDDLIDIRGPSGAFRFALGRLPME